MTISPGAPAIHVKRTVEEIATVLPRVSPRIQQAIVQYAPLHHEQRARVGVIVLSGHTQDYFLMPFAQKPQSLNEILASLYRTRYQKILHYSMAQGLLSNHLQAPLSSISAGAKTSSPAGNQFLAMARAAQNEVSRDLKAEGRFRHEPHQAIMQIDQELRSSQSQLCLIEGIGDWEAICSERPDILSALETWPDLCMQTNSLVIFAAHQPSPRLGQFFKGKPCTVESQITAPGTKELTHWLVLKELHHQELSFDPLLTSELGVILNKKAKRANVGLKTLDKSLSGYLDEQWLCLQGGRAFDPQRIDLEALQGWLDHDLIGQSEAKTAVIDAAQNLKYFGEDRKQPLWRALFTGPPGVGKTEIARGLSDFLYGHRHILLINCTEYQQEHEVAKLLGAPPGYVGYGEPSVIERFIEQYHAGVIIFDEFEKANHKVHQALMGMLEEGVLQTPTGSVVPLDRCIIIGTSNAGHREVQQLLKLNPYLGLEEIRSCYTNGVEATFDGPLLRRFDQRVIFDFLTPDELEQVAELYLNRTAQRLAPPNVDLTWSPEFVKKLVQKCDYTLGAGELKNRVESEFKKYLIEAYYKLSPKPTQVHMTESR